MSTTHATVNPREWNCQHDRCQCCGIPWVRTLREPDWEWSGLQPHHIIKRGLGGKDEACNLLCLCWRCHHQGAHNGHSRWNLTLGELLWVKQNCGDGEWNHERLLEMWRGEYNTREFTQGPPEKFMPEVLPDVYLEERKRWGYVPIT